MLLSKPEDRGKKKRINTNSITRLLFGKRRDDLVVPVVVRSSHGTVDKPLFFQLSSCTTHPLTITKRRSATCSTL